MTEEGSIFGINRRDRATEKSKRDKERKRQRAI